MADPVSPEGLNVRIIGEPADGATARARRLGPDGLFRYQFLFDLHRALFGEVWKWAGIIRQRETSIGIDPVHIPEQTRVALDDARYWHENGTFDADELAARAHYRLVGIHPFRNGNGRTTRLVADLYLTSTGHALFGWGRTRATDPHQTRSDYLAALRSVTEDDLSALIAFARS